MPRETGNIRGALSGSFRKYSASLIRAFTADFAAFMLKLLRSALLVCAALSFVSIAPAQAGPSADSMGAAEEAALPTVAVPDLLNSEDEPQLSGAPVSTPDAEISTTADAPVARPSGDLASMVADLRSSEAGSRELECLATGIYFESKSEPLAGQLAVGQVIANRANSGRFPSSYCGVLFQRGQFSFVRGHRLPAVSHSNRQWQTAVAIAKIVHQDLHESPVGKALFFHARYVTPGWRLKRVASIGNHFIYR
jgi:spore germination cell wall hydrolase CwlJ-like protein